MEDNLDNYCGFYCRSCSIRFYQETGCADGLIDCIPKVPREELMCGGCRSDSTYPGCRICRMRECAIQKGVERCVECKEYPCRIIGEFRKFTKFLPHAREMAGCQDEMKGVGIEQ